MTSSGSTFKCESCGATYSYNEDGTITRLDGESKFTKVSDWYYWEKECVRKEVEEGTFSFEDDVRMEHLEGTGVGFVPMEGNYHLTMNINDGIVVSGTNNFRYERSSLQSYAIHIEYDYKNRGACIDLCTSEDTWFAYPLNRAKLITKIHFAAEVIYDYLKEKLREDENSNSPVL